MRALLDSLFDGGAALPASQGSGSGSNLVADLLEKARPEAVPPWAVAVTAALVAVGIAVALISLIAMFSVWMERKVAGHIQCRFGPMHVGWHGWLLSSAC